MVKEMPMAKPDEFKVNDRWFRLMPLASEEDSALLRRGIEEVGVQEPIAVLSDMTILDGHQRWTIVKFNTGYPQNIPYEIRDDLDGATEDEVIKFILRRNLERRHLTSWQKVTIFDYVIDTLTEEGKEIQKANLKVGDKAPEVDKHPPRGRTREIIAQQYGIPEETQKLKKAINDNEDYETKALLDQGAITQKEAWKRVGKADRPEAVKEKPLYYIIRREDLQWPQFFVIGTAFLKWLFDTTHNKASIRMRLDFPDRKEANTLDAESDKAWKPVPFKGWACVHNVVGGCWRCFPELGETSHQKKTGAKKAEEIHIPVGREELSGFTVLPDRDMQACHKCEELWDDLNGRCKWEEGTKVPEGCKKLAHRR